MGAARSSALIPAARVERAILILRGEHVLLDADLASLYDVETKALVRAVKRNLERFPADFMFQLTPDEYADLRSQSGTSSSWGGRRYMPYAFTEHGVAMLSSVLHADRAVAVNIEIVRAFVKMRRMVASHEQMLRKVEALEQRYDHQFRVVFTAIKKLMTPVEQSARKGLIGFRVDERERK
jgi:hypothetical protein